MTTLTRADWEQRAQNLKIEAAPSFKANTPLPPPARPLTASAPSMAGCLQRSPVAMPQTPSVR